jgi:hypothetical protein
MRFFIVFGLISFLFAACRPPLPDEIPLPTQLCVKTQHHHQPIPQANIYIKYNTESFPGYDRGADYFDAAFRTGANARGCLAPIPEGRHWLVAFGYDSLYYPHEVYGSMQIEVSLNGQAKIDTILYVSE